MVKPVFIFSQPRSGSTLLQKLLMAHPKINSAPEPWFLLPVLFSRRKEGVLSIYDHETCRRAVNGLTDHLPEKEEDFYSAVRSYAESIYEKLCSNDEIYFVDKTPRYYLIIDEIARIFPDTKFIFLFRNPAAVISSSLTTWFNNRLNKICISEIDFIEGPRKLAEGNELLKDRSESLIYEEFVKSPEDHLKVVFNYLGLEYDPGILENYRYQKLDGIGDPDGAAKYDSITDIPLEKWKQNMANPVRKSILKKYIAQTDDKYLELCGISKDKLLRDIDLLKIQDSNPYHWLRDRIDFAVSNFYKKHKLIVYHPNFNWLKNRYIS